MKKLLLFVLVLLALMAATAFLVVTWLRAEDAEERAVRAENQTALQVEVNRLGQELSNSRGVESRLRQALVNEEARVGRLSRDLTAAQAEVDRLRSQVGRSGANDSRLRAAQAEVNRLRSELRRAQQSGTSESGLVRVLGRSIGCGGRDAARMLQMLGLAASVWVALVPDDLWSWLLGGICDWLASHL